MITKPQVAIISAGLGNTYGHPHPEVVDRLTTAGIEIWLTDITDQDDTVHLSSDCRRFTIEQRSATSSQRSLTPTPTPTPTATFTPTGTAGPMPSVTTSPTPSITPTATSVPTPTSTSTAGGQDVRIDCIYFDGRVPRTEADEYVQLSNYGDTVVNLAG